MLISLIQFSMLKNVNSGSQKILQIKLITCVIFLILAVLKSKTVNIQIRGTLSKALQKSIKAILKFLCFDLHS